MSAPTIIRGVRLVKITTYPVQYDPTTKTYLQHENIKTEILFTDDEPVNPVRNPDRKYRSREFVKFINALTVNAEVLNFDDAESISPYAGHYLIVAHENCVIPAQEFIEWRRKSGYKVDIIVIDADDSRNSDLIKNEIQEKYDEYLDQGIAPFDQILLIGDRANYSNCGPAAQWVLEAESGESVWFSPHHADYLYALLEGDDHHMEAGISRWPSGNANTMALTVGKTLAYEAEPYMEDTRWFTRGAVGSQHWGNNPDAGWHVTTHTNVRWGAEVLKYLGYDDIRVYENYEHDPWGQHYGPWITGVLNTGMNVIINRAETLNFQGNFWGVENNVVFPIRLNSCGHGEYGTWSMLRSGDGDNLKGVVASTTGWGSPPTIAMSIAWLGLVKGVLIHDMSFGWGRVFATTNFEKFIPNVRLHLHPVYLHVKSDIDCYGDPGIQHWRGVPQIYEMEHVDAITPQARIVEVNVFDPDNEEPLEGGRVSIYVPGDLPDDADDYAEHEFFMITSFTDEDGIARFVFDEDQQFEEGTMYVTLTGRSILPRFGEIAIETPASAIDLIDYELTESEGNEDGEVNPGETFNLTLTATNSGENEAVENVTAVVTSLSQWVEVEENHVQFGSIGAGSEADGEGNVFLQIHQACPDGEARPSTEPVLLVEFTSGEAIWRAGIQLVPAAPNFTVSNIPEGIIIPTDRYELDIEIENSGSINSPSLSAELISFDEDIEVIESAADFPEIETGEQVTVSGDNFVILGSELAIPGSKTRMMLILTTEDGFVDTAHFELQVSEARDEAPQGPDDYGYICFDDTDSDWEMAPEHEWLEISLLDDDRDYNGSRHTIRTQGWKLHTDSELKQTETLSVQIQLALHGRLILTR